MDPLSKSHYAYRRHIERAHQLRAQAFAAGMRALLRLTARGARALAAALRAGWRRLRAAQRRRAAVAELLALSDAGLKDIGLSRSGVWAAVTYGRERPRVAAAVTPIETARRGAPRCSSPGAKAA